MVISLPIGRGVNKGDQKLNSNSNSNNPQKKIGKQKLKEVEQEEQLKMARSVINSLERKVEELFERLA